MTSARRLAGLSIVCAFMWAPMTAAFGQDTQGGQADTSPPTAIEEALIEHACGALRPAGALETDAYLACRQNQLLSLRSEFGRDLKRLSAAERRTIDSACSALRAPQGQDAYLRCMTAQLASMRGKGSRAKQPEAPTDPAASPSVPSAVETPPVSPPASRSGLWIGAAGVALLVAAAGAFVVVRARRSFGKCRTCGVKLAERGDLCQKCRHEAAEALRRATAERAEQARLQEEEQRQKVAREEEQRQQLALDEERRRQLEESQKEQARQLEAQAERQREEDARLRRQADAPAASDEFDPHAVLGIKPDASVAEVEAAYQTAKAKYDLELVADMGVELQEHFKRKGQLVERAHEMLAARPPE